MFLFQKKKKEEKRRERGSSVLTGPGAKQQIPLVDGAVQATETAQCKLLTFTLYMMNATNGCLEL